MIKKNIMMHITNDKIYIKKNDNLIKEDTIYFNEEKNKYKTVVNGKVYSYTHFLNLLNKIIKKHKLNNSIFNNNVTVIVNSFTTPLEKQMIINMFKVMSFNKIIIYKETKILKKINEENKILLNINTDYTEIFYYQKTLKTKKRVKKSTFLTSKQYLKIVTDIISKLVLNKKYKKPFIIAYGNKQEIKKISNILEKKLKIKISKFEDNSQLINYIT